jgi:hypothetical protein
LQNLILLGLPTVPGMGIVIFIITEIEGYEYLLIYKLILIREAFCKLYLHLTRTAVVLSELYSTCAENAKIYAKLLCMDSGARFRARIF